MRQDGEPGPARPSPAGRRAQELVADAAAVIFDLDGVLVDTEPWWHEVRVAFAGSRGRDWTIEDSRACMGRNSAEWSLVMRQRLGIDDRPEVIERAVVDALVDRYRRGPVPVVDGAPEAAARIAGRVPAAIASSAHHEVIAAALAATGLAPRFGVVVSSDDVATGKPAPDVYLAAAGRLGVDPSRCIVIEDSLNGALAGRAAGMRVVLVPTASLPPEAGAFEAADLVLPRLADLPVDALGSRP